jgi:hypothetical protein
MADKAGEGAPRATAVLSSQRLKLQTSYGQAMIHARGYSAPETTAAFARARELTAGIETAADPFSIYYGLWVGNFVRGELAPMRDIAEIIKGEVEVRPGSPEAGVAARLNGTTDWFAGNFADARVSLKRALAIFDYPERDSDLAFRFAQDLGVSITAQGQNVGQIALHATRQQRAGDVGYRGEQNIGRHIAEQPGQAANLRRQHQLYLLLQNLFWRRHLHLHLRCSLIQAVTFVLGHFILGHFILGHFILRLLLERHDIPQIATVTD